MHVYSEESPGLFMETYSQFILQRMVTLILSPQTLLGKDLLWCVLMSRQISQICLCFTKWLFAF